MLFVLGTGRSGTHTACALLETDPDVVSLHEGLPYNCAFDPELIVQIARTGLNQFLEYRGFDARFLDVGVATAFNVFRFHYADHHDPALDVTTSVRGNAREILEACFTKRHRVIREVQRRRLTYCESSRHLYSYIDYISKHYPEARFLHLVRNPFQTIGSWLKRKGAYPDPCDYEWQLPARFSIDRFNRREIMTWILEKPRPIRGSDDGNRWEHISRIEKIAWFWNYITSYIEDRFTSLPDDRHMSLRLEDLNADSWSRVQVFAGIGGEFPEHLVTHDASEGSSELDPQQREVCQPILSATASRVGY